MSLELLENNWDEIYKKVVNPAWFKFKYIYESCKLNKDDFDSLAGIILIKSFKNDYNPEKSNMFTYAANVLQRKAKSEITFYRRKKRGGGVPEMSLDKFVDESDDTTLGEMIPVEEKHDIDILVQRYLDSLTKKQRQIAELMMQGYSDRDIKAILKMSNEQYVVAVMSMKKDEKIAPLKVLKERMRCK